MDDDGDADAVPEAMRAKEAAVEPDRPGDCMALAGAARRRQEYSGALALVKDFNSALQHAGFPTSICSSHRC